METKTITHADISLEERVITALNLAQTMIAQGYKNDEIRMTIMKEGFNYYDAETILEEAYEEGSSKSKAEPTSINEAKSNDVFVGLLWLTGGLLITAITYSAAKENGGMYIVAYGPVIYGLVRLIKGL